MVLAVYIPPQAPGPGHAWRTTSNRSSSAIFPTAKAPENVVSVILPLQVNKKRTIRFECVRNIDCVALLVTHRRTIWTDMSMFNQWTFACEH